VQIFNQKRRGVKMGIRKYSKTFKNIQKLSENIQKLTRNIRKYSKILKGGAQMVLSGCIRSTMGSAVMGNSSFDFAPFDSLSSLMMNRTSNADFFEKGGKRL